MDLLAFNRTGPAIISSGDEKYEKYLEVMTDKSHVSASTAEKLNSRAQQKILGGIARNISHEYGANGMEHNDAPAIRHSEKPLTSKAQVLLAMQQFQLLSAATDEHGRTNSMAVYLAQHEANSKKANELSESLDKLHDEFDACTEAVDAAKENEENAGQNVVNAEAKLNAAQKKLTDLLAALGVTSADDPAVSNNPDVISANKAIADAGKALNEAKSNVIAAHTTTQKALNAAQNKLNEINKKTAELNAEVSSNEASGISNSPNAATQSGKALTRTAIMIELLTEFIMKMDEASAEKLKNDLEINRVQSKGRQAEMKQKSDEYEEQVRKAEEAQKMAGCIGKILGGVAIALGAATSIFGGAGVALMAVGIGLMVADPIVEAITGESLTGMIMNPLMEHVFMPLMNLVGGIVNDIFDKTPIGLLLKAIDNATGANMMDTIHTVVAAAVTIAAIVAMAFVAKSAAKFMIEKMTQVMTTAIVQAIKKAITQIISKMIPKMVKSAAKKGATAVNQAGKTVAKQIDDITKQITQKLDKVSQKVNKSVLNVLKPDDPEVLKNMAKMSLNRMEMLRVGVYTANPVVQGGMSINIADIQLQAAKTLAEFDMANTDINLLRDMVVNITSRFKQDQELVESMSLSLSETLKNTAFTGQSIMRNIKA